MKNLGKDEFMFSDCADNRIIIIDFEVLSKAKFWMCCLKEYETKKEYVIVNDLEEFKRVFEENKDSIWVGYNIKNYDSWIVKSLLTGYSPFEVNDKIIKQGVPGWKINEVLKTVNFNYFEVGSQQRSLKELELFMGESIVESDISFDLDRYPTEEEIKILTKYCMHDVRMTYEVFKYMFHEYEAQQGLIELFSLDKSAFSKTKSQLSSLILEAKKPFNNRNDEFKFNIVNTISLNKYADVKAWYMNLNNRNYDNGLTKDIYGVSVSFGWGGLHGARPRFEKKGIIINSDVSSFYPGIMIEYDMLSRNVKNKDKFREIRDKRIELKKLKDKKSNSLKIVLNGTFGASKDKYNELYDPLMCNSVCVNGQLLLLDLIEKVEYAIGDKAVLIQCNTDGVMFYLENEETKELYFKVCDEWCSRTRMNLEHDEIVNVIQKDVNNYVYVDTKNNIKCKGAYLKELSHIDNDLPIVNEALRNKLLYDIPIEDTINKSMYLVDFQKCVKLSNKYAYALHNDKKINLKVLRVFASKRTTDGPISKVKADTLAAEKIANSPEHAFINNANIKGVIVPDILDKQWYIDLANKRLNEFKPEPQQECNLLELVMAR